MAILTKDEFLKLHELILAKHAQFVQGKDPVRNKTSALYGFLEYDPEDAHAKHQEAGENSIKGLMIKEFKDYLEETKSRLNGKRLYDIHKDFVDNKSETYTLKPPFEKVYFEFIGIEGDYLENFRKTHMPASDTTTASFTGFYFSEIDGKVKKFELNMTISPSGRIDVEERGLHKIQESDKEIIHTGKAVYNNNHLHIDLYYKATSGEELRRLSFIVSVGGIENFQNREILRASFQGISVQYNRPISGECILYNKKYQKDDAQANEAIINSYLLLNRKSFKVSSELLLNVKKLKEKERLPDSFIRLAETTYRIWNFGFRGNIMQSKFIISHDFQSTLSIPQREGRASQVHIIEKRCFLHIGGDKLCVTSGDDYYHVSNLAIIDIGNPDKNGIMKGVFSSVGNIDPITNFMVVVKEDKDFDACEINVVNYESLLAGDQSKMMKLLLENLLKSMQGFGTFWRDTKKRWEKLGSNNIDDRTIE